MIYNWGLIMIVFWVVDMLFQWMSRLLVSKGGELQNAWQRDKLLYWYIHSFLWGRYTHGMRNENSLVEQ